MMGSHDKAIRITGDIDDAGREWERGVATEWADDLQDAQQDIYTLEDGEPL